MIRLQWRHTLLATMSCCMVTLTVKPATAGFSIADETMYLKQVALVIGMSNYQNGWNKLGGVKKDQEAVQAALKRNGFDTVALLKDLPHDELKIAIEEFIAANVVDEETALLIYYAGHGDTIIGPEGRQHGFVIPIDALPHGGETPEQYSAQNKAIPMSYFRQLSDNIVAKHTLFVFDSCFSGSIFSTMRGSASRPLDIQILTDNPARQFISSGSANQLVPDVSQFRREFIKALNGMADLNKDGYIIGTELGLYLRQQVTRVRRGQQTPQFARLINGQFRGELQQLNGDFVFESPVRFADDPSTSQRSITGVDFGNQLRDCGVCPEMVWVPKGEIVLADSRKLSVGSTYAISATEVTLAQWRACFDAAGCDLWLDSDDTGNNPNLPAQGLSWADAQQYVSWLNGKLDSEISDSTPIGTKPVYSLPTANQWEYAARAKARGRYPWGDDLDHRQANCATCAGPDSGRSASPVASFQANAFGLYDVIGNVWEWTRDCVVASEHESCPQPVWNGSGYTTAGGKVIYDLESYSAYLRGGSYGTRESGLGLSVKSAYPAGSRLINAGFRVVRE